MAQPLPVRQAIFVTDRIPHGYEGFGPTGPYYPERPARAAVAGGAVIRCALTADGVLHDCLLSAEKPQGYDFGIAALVMVRRGLIKAEPRVVDGQPIIREDVLVVVPFQPPSHRPR